MVTNKIFPSRINIFPFEFLRSVPFFDENSSRSLLLHWTWLSAIINKTFHWEWILLRSSFPKEILSLTKVVLKSFSHVNAENRRNERQTIAKTRRLIDPLDAWGVVIRKMMSQRREKAWIHQPRSIARERKSIERDSETSPSRYARLHPRNAANILFATILVSRGSPRPRL